MKKTIVALGAGWAIMQQPDNPIHKYILNLAQKPKPSILFIPTASGDNESYIDSYYKIYTQDKCIPSDLKLFHREELDLREYILKNDIIHVGGGNTANMLAVWKVHGVDTILREAWEMGKILCGGSAGAICWFESGVTDSFGTSKLAPLSGCLGFLDGSICPHYDGDELRRSAYHDFLKQELLPGGYAADEDVALHFEDSILKAALASSKNGRAYMVSLVEGVVQEQPIEVTQL